MADWGKGMAAMILTGAKMGIKVAYETECQKILNGGVFPITMSVMLEAEMNRVREEVVKQQRLDEANKIAYGILQAAKETEKAAKDKALADEKTARDFQRTQTKHEKKFDGIYHCLSTY